MRCWALFSVLSLLAEAGCASQMNSNLLQARVRDQAMQLTDAERELASVRTELNKSQFEIERIRAELASLKQDPSDDNVVLTAGTRKEVGAQISKLHIHSMASGGLNRDHEPGDDAIAIQFAPIDRHGNSIQVPGDVEIVLIDPRVPEGERERGRWNFSADECEKQWTRGLTGSGYQFTVPLESPADHKSLVVQLRFCVDGDREFRASRLVKVEPSAGASKSARRSPVRREMRVAENEIEDIPAAGIFPDDSNEAGFDEGDLEELETRKVDRKSPLRDSTNWTDASTPVIR